ncbi:MAG: phasin family protein [Sphingobium sp.]
MASKASKTVGGQRSSTLSASEALKAAEAAIGDPKPVAKAIKPAAKPKAAPTVKAPVNAPARPVAKAATMPKASPAPKAAPAPAAVVVASTAVDAAPEPIEPAARVSETPTIAETLIPTTEPAGAKAEPVEAATLPLLEGNKMMTDVIETAKKFAEDAKAKLETAYAGLNEKAKDSVEKSTKALGEFSDLAKGNVEALVESGKIAAKGFETLGQDAVDYSRKNIEKAQATIKSFSGVKTPTEFFQLQSALLSSSFDEFTKEAAKSSEAFVKLAGDIAAPLTARATIMTDKVKSLAA